MWAFKSCSDLYDVINYLLLLPGCNKSCLVIPSLSALLLMHAVGINSVVVVVAAGLATCVLLLNAAVNCRIVVHGSFSAFVRKFPLNLNGRPPFLFLYRKLISLCGREKRERKEGERGRERRSRERERERKVEREGILVNLLPRHVHTLRIMQEED